MWSFLDSPGRSAIPHRSASPIPIGDSDACPRDVEPRRATVREMNAFHRHENGQHDFWTHFWFGLTVGGWVEGGCSTGVDTRPASVCAELVAPSRHNGANELAGTRNIPRFMA